ncbi:hypothetical protein J6590_080592 [Homalodisca vitripennis]|nr:hypothetical protein J6590_080592 [Homalodisca vitripennis]
MWSELGKVPVRNALFHQCGLPFGATPHFQRKKTSLKVIFNSGSYVKSNLNLLIGHLQAVDRDREASIVIMTCNFHSNIFFRPPFVFERKSRHRFLCYYPTFIRAGVMCDCVSRTRDLCSGLAFSAVITPGPQAAFGRNCCTLRPIEHPINNIVCVRHVIVLGNVIAFPRGSTSDWFIAHLPVESTLGTENSRCVTHTCASPLIKMSCGSLTANFEFFG